MFFVHFSSFILHRSYIQYTEWAKKIQPRDCLSFSGNSERVALKFWNVKNRHHELQFNCYFQHTFQCDRTHYIVCNSLNLCKTHTLLSIAYISFSLAACNAHNNKVSAKSNLLKNALNDRGFEKTRAKQGKCKIKLKFAERKINNRESE